MEIIQNIFEGISNLGSQIMIPLMIMIIGLIFRLGFAKSFRAGLTIGIGFIGVNMVTNYMLECLVPASNLLLDKFNLNLQYIDVGWTVGSAIAFSTSIGAFIIPFIIIINVIMLATKLTQTVNVDIWNYWHYAFCGAMVATLTGNIVYGFIAAALQAALSLKVADLAADKVQSVIGIPGVSIPQGYAVSSVPLGLAMEWVYNKIPGFNKIKTDSETLSRRLGIFGEPATIGFVLGVLFGFLVGYGPKEAVTLGIQLGAVMLILPRMVKILMEGMVPISNAARDMMNRRFAGKSFYIGMDSAITLGHPTTIAAGILLVPITILLAAVLPYNSMLPAADLAAGAFYVCMFTALHHGDLVRTLITGTVMQAFLLFSASYFAPAITALAKANNYAFPEGAVGVTTAVNPFATLIALIMQNKLIGAIIAIALVVAFFVICTMWEKKKAAKAS